MMSTVDELGESALAPRGRGGDGGSGAGSGAGSGSGSGSGAGSGSGSGSGAAVTWRCGPAVGRLVALRNLAAQRVNDRR